MLSKDKYKKKRKNKKMLKRNKEPEFCIIAPTNYLHTYASQSSMHLDLAHLVDHDEEYSSFYAERNEYKIMDNGAFELGESYAPDKLIGLARKCKANAIVLPDYPAQHHQKTMAAAEELIPEVKDAGFDTFFCPQSEIGDWEGLCNAYLWASIQEDIDIIGMSILTFPNALPHIPAAYARVVGTALLIEKELFNFNKYHHYLGLNAGPGLEIPPLIKMNALDSCDSSGPVWQGILGHEYTLNTESLSPVKKIKNEVQFDLPWISDYDLHRRIQHNINLTLELFEENVKTTSE